jgi:hypothetical protein
MPSVHTWTMVHRRDLTHPALAALGQAIDQLAAAEDWLGIPAAARSAGVSAGSTSGASRRRTHAPLRRPLRHQGAVLFGDDISLASPHFV